jgi:hypothetical protein
MADTLPLVILKAIETALGVASVTTDASTVIAKPTGLAVSRTYATVKENAVQMVVKMADEGVTMGPEAAEFRKLACEMFADVVCFKNGDPPEEYLDPLVQWAHAAVMDTYSTTTGRYLSGNALWVAPAGVTFEGERGSADEGAAVVKFRILYHTAADDPALGV